MYKAYMKLSEDLYFKDQIFRGDLHNVFTVGSPYFYQEITIKVLEVFSEVFIKFC